MWHSLGQDGGRGSRRLPCADRAVHQPVLLSAPPPQRLCVCGLRHEARGAQRNGGSAGAGLGSSTVSTLLGTQLPHAWLQGRSHTRLPPGAAICTHPCLPSAHRPLACRVPTCTAAAWCWSGRRRRAALTSCAPRQVRPDAPDALLSFARYLSAAALPWMSCAPRQVGAACCFAAGVCGRVSLNWRFAAVAASCAACDHPIAPEFACCPAAAAAAAAAL